MESGDILAFIAGIVIVIFVALMANHTDLSRNPFSSEMTIQATETLTLSPAPGTSTFPDHTLNPEKTAAAEKSGPIPYRIFYTDKPFTYPVYTMPEHMETFGASEIPSQSQEWVRFAFIEGSRGGLTQVFSVPYPVWVINTTVIARHHPQYSNLRFVLCYADTGGVIEGEEILNRGTSYRVVQTSNTDIYFIISVDSIDSFIINLETPRAYYEVYTPK